MQDNHEGYYTDNYEDEYQYSPVQTMSRLQGLKPEHISQFGYQPQPMTDFSEYQAPRVYNAHNRVATAGLGLNMPMYQYKQPHQVQANNGGAYQGGLPAGGMSPYNVVPTVSMQPTANGGPQFNLNQRTLQYQGDPDYQRLYQLREAQARQKAAQMGLNYDRMLAAATAGTAY